MKQLILGALAMVGMMTTARAADLLTPQEKAIVGIGAATARGDQAALATAFRNGFDAGLSLNEAKELVGQLYAYCGFPRALNAAGTLMKVTEERTNEGKRPANGPVNGPLPAGKSIDFGAANQTKLCGRPVKGPLFDFHPQLDEYLKAHLFGDIFARDSLSWRTREIVTIAALAARPETEPQMKSHIAVGKVNGVTDEQAAAILRLVRCPADPALLPPDWSAFPVGEPNIAYAKYFIGRSFLAPVSREQLHISAVTFEPGCRNNWHIHHAKSGGGQILIVTAGEGYYQEWGKPARRIRKGDTVNIPAGVKHWHGAAPDCWFQHLAMEVPGEGGRNEWLEPVDDKAYSEAIK
ncbi:MAG: carboxymuconolactone decarboxylase family protein [Victivallales bacterium]|nr:carboxymuconolactone decarboxylase family protein [Victivallales bacterium]